MSDLGVFSNLGQVLQLAVAVLAVAFAIWTYTRTRDDHTLLCELDQPVFPVTVDSDLAPRGLELRFNGEPVPGLFIMQARLRNMGTHDIEAKSVDEPLTFEFGPETRLLQRDIQKTEKGEAVAEWAPGKPLHPAVLVWRLLKAGEDIKVQFVCTGESQYPQVTCRVKDYRLDPLDAKGQRLRDNARNAAGTLWFFLALLPFLALVIFLADKTPPGLFGPSWEGYPEASMCTSAPLWGLLLFLVVLTVPRFWLTVGDPLMKWRSWRRLHPPR
jgi:hypothetical protein